MKVRHLLFAVSLSAACAVASAAAIIEPVLEVHRIEVGPAGEVRAIATTAKPGDVLEYAAVYRNRGDAGAHQMRAVIPVPTGTAYVTGSAQPAASEGSLDGKTFQPLPLKRPGKDAQGRLVQVDVPASEYRALAWSVPVLQAGAERRFSARVTVSAGDPQ